MTTRTGVFFASSLGVALFLIGCQEPAPQGFEKFTPSPEVGRMAITTALESWRQGSAPGMIDTASPKLLLVDARRFAGRALASFEVLGEFPAENGRGFVARLGFKDDGPEEPPTARYCIVGIDPLYIYRQEDLDMFCHWTHPMDDSTPEKVP